MENYETAVEIADRLGLKTQTIWEWARMDYIPHHRLGPGKRARYRFLWSEVKNWDELRSRKGRLNRLPD